MTLKTRICVYRDADNKTVKRKAEQLLSDIRAFANMDNCAFWNDGVIDGQKTAHCVIVRGYFGDLESGQPIETKQIEQTMQVWCREVADFCRDDPDEGEDEYSHKEFAVEVRDLVNAGGLSVKCFDKAGSESMGIYVLPIYKNEYEN